MRISDWSSDVCFFRSFILPHHPAHPPRPERRDDDAAEHRLAFARNAIVERAEGGGQKKDAGAGHGWRGYRRERIIGKRPFVAPSPPRRRGPLATLHYAASGPPPRGGDDQVAPNGPLAARVAPFGGRNQTPADR